MNITKEWIEKAIDDSVTGYIVVWCQGHLMIIYKDKAEIDSVFGVIEIDKEDAIRRLALVDVRNKIYEDGRWELNDEIRG